MHTFEEAREVCQKYVDKLGLCVTFTQTEFIFTKGSEPGVLIGLINYPRFPQTPYTIKERALMLAQTLKEALGQNRVSVIFSDETIMLGEM
jgi:hypothetical protein